MNILFKWAMFRFHVEFQGSTSWWLNQSIWKICASQIGSFTPNIGLKIPTKTCEKPPGLPWLEGLDKPPGPWWVQADQTLVILKLATKCLVGFGLLRNPQKCRQVGHFFEFTDKQPILEFLIQKFQDDHVCRFSAHPRKGAL